MNKLENELRQTDFSTDSTGRRALRQRLIEQASRPQSQHLPMRKLAAVLTLTLFVGVLLAQFLMGQEAPIESQPIISNVQNAPSLREMELEPITPDNFDQLIRLASYGNGSVNTVEWHGDVIAVGGSQGIWLHDANNLLVEPHLLPHPYPVNALAFSPDGRYLASGDSVGDVNIWAVASGNLLVTLHHDDLFIHDIAFNRDSSLLAVGVGDSREAFTTSMEIDFAVGNASVYVWQVPDTLTENTDDLLIWTFDEAHAGVSVAFSPTEDVLALGGNQDLNMNSDFEVIRLVDTQTWEIVKEIASFGGNVSSLAFSSDGNKLIAGGMGQFNMFQAWDLSTNESINRFSLAEYDPNLFIYQLTDLMVLPDDQTVLAVSDTFESSVIQWDLVANEFSTIATSQANLRDIAINPDSEYIAIVNNEGVGLSTINGTFLEDVVSLPRYTAPNMVNFVDDAWSVAAIQSAHDGRIVDTSTGQAMLQHDMEMVISADQNPLHMVFIEMNYANATYTQSPHPFISLWSVADNIKREIDVPQADFGRAVAIHPNRSIIAYSYLPLGVNYGNIVFYNINTQEETRLVHQLTRRKTPSHLVFLDRDHIAGVSPDGVLRIWNMAGELILENEEVGYGEVNSQYASPIDVSPSQDAAVFTVMNYATNERKLVMVNVEADSPTFGDIIYAIDNPEFSNVQFGNTDDVLFATGRDQFLMLDAATGEILQGVNAHVGQYDLRADSKVLVTISGAGTLDVWGVPAE